MEAAKNIDPVLIPTIERRLTSISEEIGVRTIRSCYSFPTGQARDIGTQIFDDQEQLVTQAEWLPVHCGGSNIALKGILDHIGRDNVFPDDFIIGNDPYIVRAGHLPDWSFVRPVFYDGKLMFYLYMRTHQYDGGGANQSCYYPRSFDVHGEGLIIPPLKLIERGKINERAYSVILSNVRGSSMVRADNMLINNSMKIAEERIIDLCREYGPENVKLAHKKLIDYTEDWVRRTIKKWPGGTYTSQGIIDSDGTTRDIIYLNLSLTIDSKAGQLIFDFRDNIDQVDFVNGTLGVVYSSTLTPLRWSLPAGLSRNHGLYKCISILTKRGTICDPVYPASCGGQGPVFGSAVLNAVHSALSRAVPYDTPAGWTPHATPVLSGKHPFRKDPKTGLPRPYWVSTFTSEGSSGAIWGYDGWNSLGHSTGSGAILRAPIEIQEHDLPWRFIQCEWLTDSAGDGQWRGGMGTIAEHINLHPKETFKPADCYLITGNDNGETFGQFGLLGGTGTKKNEMWIKRNGMLSTLHTMDIVSSEPGDILITSTGGGGGVGNPMDRDPEKVRLDVLNEYISEEKARTVYGVALLPGKLEIDYETTKKLRDKDRKQ